MALVPLKQQQQQQLLLRREVARVAVAGRGPLPCAVLPPARYLVDPASSHMLVSKIKPCMSKYTPFDGETANGSLNHT